VLLDCVRSRNDQIRCQDRISTLHRSDYEYLSEDGGSRRGTIVKLILEKKAGNRRRCRCNAGIRTWRLEDRSADHRRHPRGCVLQKALPAGLSRSMLLYAGGGPGSGCREAIAGGHAHGERTHGG
jgi:hypothetical protein